MTLEEFKRLLDTYGADLGRWPAQDRAAADSLCRNSDSARQTLASAGALDALFRQDRDRIATPARETAIVNAALRRIRTASETSFDWRRFLSKGWGAMAAAAVLAGWLAGVVAGPSIEPAPQHGISAIAVLLGDETANIEDFL